MSQAEPKDAEGEAEAKAGGPAQSDARKPLDARTLARLGAIQCLYQMETTGQGVDAAVREYRQHRLGGELDGEAIRDADDDFFEALVRGVVETQRRIDPYIQRRLKPGWTLKRLDSVARAALRCALYELIRLPNVPRRVVIGEYVAIVSSFFGEGEAEPRFVNGVLDTAAREIRADEDEDGAGEAGAGGGDADRGGDG